MSPGGVALFEDQRNTCKVKQPLSDLRDRTAEGKWTKSHSLNKLLLSSSEPLDAGDVSKDSLSHQGLSSYGRETQRSRVTRLI